MMNHSLNRILDSPHDYKICEECGQINWYESKVCHTCYCCLPESSEVSEVISFAQEELSFYKEELNYQDEQAGLVKIEV